MPHTTNMDIEKFNPLTVQMQPNDRYTIISLRIVFIIQISIKWATIRNGQLFEELTS